MKTRIVLLFCLFVFIFPASAQTTGTDYRYIIEIVDSLKSIIHQQKDDKSSRAVLSRIKGAKPLLKDGRYRGHQVFVNRELAGLIGIEYQQNKATIAVFSTPPLRVRHATKRYKTFRNLLAKHFKETGHNHYELSEQVIARIKKQARKITIDVYRKK